MSRTKKIYAADLFCGAGGMSQGLLEACKQQGYSLELIAINHWTVAIDTHSANHQYAKHLCANLETVDPKKLVPSGRLQALTAGIECTHHSNARGGKPRNDQSRSSAWLLLKWASELYIETIIIENVKEFRSWGPLGADKQPLKSKRGETFMAFIAALKSLGYNVAHRILCAADYGDPTTRERLFIIARRGGKPIVWPEPSHAHARKKSDSQKDLFAKAQPWRTAREIIDWDLKGESIFTRKRELAQKTKDRIAAGLRKFGGPNAEPFLVMLYGTNDARSVDRPVPTVTANGNHIGLAEPFLVNLKGKSDALSIDGPSPTITTHGAGALVEPFIIEVNHGENGNIRAARSLNEPLGTVTQKRAHGLIDPFLVKYNSTGKAMTTKDRFGLITTEHGTFKLDIRFRMLTNRELARAQGLDDSYILKGKKSEVTKQIGNMVPRNTARALCAQVLG